MEYERRWHPDDIPDAAYGMRQGRAYVRGILDTLAMVEKGDALKPAPLVP
ncbi:MAG: hypothetical protein LUE17_13120 [Planctomycetaceae bacterium]|nr:hypothetical protein [Planctomycetaceae bacterium]